MEAVDDDHQCKWRTEVVALRKVVAEHDEKLESVLQQLQVLQRSRLGKSSEKMPPIGKELRKSESSEDAEARRLLGLERRRQRAALKQNLQKQTVTHHVSEAGKACPACGGCADGKLGEGKRTTMFEYVPGYFVRQEHVQEKLACRCGEYIAMAEPPPKPVDKGQYGAGFVAHLVTMKCADSIPLHRLAKQYQRLGIPMARSTLNDLFHAAAERVRPLSERLLQIIARSDLVQADETPITMQSPNRKGYMWTFLAENLIAYKFSGDRSGDTPLGVLGASVGTLVVDAYTGYNRVTDVDGRTRSGCLAHVRRKFFDALPNAPNEARQALDLILDVYRVEHVARARKIVRTNEHLRLRQTDGRQAMDRLHEWILNEQPKHSPKSGFGQALSYAVNQWPTLLHFLDNERIPLDNNASEGALRVVALGRKNFLFVGDEDAGDHLAGLYSLVATCEAHDVDPVAYLKDVLIRVNFHPNSRIDELLPHKWLPPISWTVTQ